MGKNSFDTSKVYSAINNQLDRLDSIAIDNQIDILFSDEVYDYKEDVSFYSSFPIQEIESFYNTIDDVEQKKILLFHCSDEFKINEIGLFLNGILTGKDFINLILSINDDYNRTKAFNIYIDSVGLDFFHILLSRVPDDAKFYFLKMFFNNQTVISEIRGFHLSAILNIFSDEQKDLIIDFYYDFEKRYGLDIINEITLYRCLREYSPDKRVEKYNKLVVSNDRYNEFAFINVVGDISFKFELLEKIISENYLDNEDNKNLELFDNICNIIQNIENEFPDTNEKYNNLLSFYSDNLNLNYENLVNFINKFGYISLKYLTNENVKKVINLNVDKFNSFMNFFNENNLNFDVNSLNTAINAILQREFILQCKDDYNIFAKFEGLINNSLLAEIESNLLKVSEVVNIKKILSKYNIDLKIFVDDLVNGRNNSLNILHEITNLYIMKKRENYVKDRMLSVFDELNLNKKYEKNFIKKKWIATTSEFDIRVAVRYDVVRDELTNEQIDFIDNYDVLNEVIKFKKEPNQYVLDDSLKKYLKVFDSVIDILYEKDKLKDVTNDVNAKYVYSSKQIESYVLLDLISELNIDIIDDKLLSDKNLLSKFNNFLSKYKVLGWNDTFDSLRDSADFNFSNNTLVGLFNYFYKINSEVNVSEKNISLTKVLSLGNCYASSSSKYTRLFGDDVYRFLSANAGKNKAPMIREKRINHAVSHVVDMYKRELVPIPPMDENILLNNGKSINVVVGNCTDMQNLVLGEMTDACMRVGGAFYDFYQECLIGKNGFHIVLSQPGSDKFISRVSGLRNGNTLFLNELRHSVYSEYSDEDCINTIKEVARMLVKKSKDSEFPIENVVITSDMAMEEYKNEMQSLNLEDRKSALFGLNHNLARDGSAIILASSNSDNSLVEVQLGEDKISYYKPQRGKIKEYYGEDAVKRVIQIKGLVNKLLDGKDISLVEMDVDNTIDVVYCVSNNDWFISVDSKGEIEQFILDNCNDKERAMEEISYNLSIVNDLGVSRGGGRK